MAEQELSALYVRSQTYCLNAHPSHPFSNLNVGDNSLCLRSDTDEQLLIHIVFQTAVRLSAISVKAPADDSAPTSLRLYSNLSNPGFTDIEDLEMAQAISLTLSDLDSGRKIALKPVKFQRVTALTVFVPENGGEEFTSLSALKLYGFTLDGLDVSTIHQQHSHQHQHQHQS